MNQPSNIPIPDPTLLTTELTKREISALRELVEEKISALRHVHDEKFASIQVQFQANQVALNAALDSQKEAVGKSEASTVKQLDALLVLIQTTANGIESKISDVKDRITMLEGRGEGKDRATSGMQNSTGLLLAIIGALVGVAVAVFK